MWTGEWRLYSKITGKCLLGYGWIRILDFCQISLNSDPHKVYWVSLGSSPAHQVVVKVTVNEKAALNSLKKSWEKNQYIVKWYWENPLNPICFPIHWQISIPNIQTDILDRLTIINERINFEYLFVSNTELPSSPVKVHVLSARAHTVLLSWVPGFDGYSPLNSCSVLVNKKSYLTICSASWWDVLYNAYFFCFQQQGCKINNWWDADSPECIGVALFLSLKQPSSPTNPSQWNQEPSFLEMVQIMI